MADYNINAVTRRVVFSGSAGTGPYAFTFEVLDQTDLAVYFNAVKLTLTTDYTVSVAANGTGSVTIVTGTNVPSTPVAADQITIVGARDIERTTDFVTAGDLRAAALNEQLDGQIIMVQQISEESKRAMRAPVYDPALVEDGGVVDMELPTKASRAGNYLAFDTDGNPTVGVEVGVFRGDWAASTAYALRDIVKDTTNNNIYIATTAHTSSGSLPISSNADVAKWALIVDAAAAAASATSASGFADEAEAWAKKTDGEAQVGEGYSSKAWAVGGTGVTDTAAAGAAKEWATETSGTVDTSDYSAKEYASGTQSGAGGSAKEWAQRAEDSAVPGGGGEYSAKHYSAKASASASSASTSASNASTSASAASTSASDASTSASAASSSAASAAASFDSFDDRYLGAKSSAPALDNDGDPLIPGALFFDSTAGEMKVYNGSGWVATGSTISSVYQRFEYTASGGETSVTGADDNANTLAYDAGFIMVFLNGVMLNDGDYTATSGTSITGLAALTAGDKLEVIAHGAAAPGDYYSKSASDAKYALLGANTDITSLTLADGSSSAPALANTGDTNTGIFFPAADTVGVAVGGTEVWRFGSNPTTAKNLIINGAMTVAQRGSTNIAAGAVGYGGPDRWEALSGATAAYTLTADTDVPSGQGFTKSLKVDITTGDASISSGEHYHVRTKLEGTNVSHLMLGTANAKTVTLQFWARSRITGIHCVSLQNSAENRSYVFEYTIASADTWEFFTKTVALDQSGTWLTTTGIGLSLVWSLGAGSSYQGTADTWNAADDEATSNQVNVVSSTGTFGLAGVQLEIGSVGTDFEHEDYGTTLEKCQRYFRRWTVQDSSSQIFGSITMNAATNAFLGPVAHPVEMRLSPTISISDVGHVIVADGANANKTCSAFTAYPNATAWSALFTVASGTTGGGYIYRDVTDALYFDFTAEL